MRRQMTIKRATSNSDDPITLQELTSLKTKSEPIRSHVESVRDWEYPIITEKLQHFEDPEYWKIAYDFGYKTYMSTNNDGEPNEIVYLIKYHRE